MSKAAHRSLYEGIRKKILKQVYKEGEWLPSGDADAKEIEAMQAKGLVFYGTKWLPAKEADKLRGSL